MSNNNPQASIPHPCLTCGKMPRAELTGINCASCQAKVAKTWGSRPDRQSHEALREDRLGRLYREHVEGRRDSVRIGPNGGVH